MEIRYTGRNRAVVLADRQTVKRGGSVVVDDALAVSLLSRPDFEQVEDKATKTTKTKPATPAPDKEED